MHVFFLVYYYLMRTLPELFNSANLYFLLESILFMILSIYIFKKSEKIIFNLFFCLGLWILLSQQIIDRFLLLLNFQVNDYFNISLLISLSFISHILIFRNRYKWEKLKSVDYDSTKVQAVYSEPEELLTLFGAAFSLSPKCSVRYIHNGRMIRFKRGYPTPIMSNNVIKKTDIIHNTTIYSKYFYERFEEIKNKKYNVVTFNCRHLFKINKKYGRNNNI